MLETTVLSVFEDLVQAHLMPLLMSKLKTFICGIFCAANTNILAKSIDIGCSVSTLSNKSHFTGPPILSTWPLPCDVANYSVKQYTSYLHTHNLTRGIPHKHKHTILNNAEMITGCHNCLQDHHSSMYSQKK